MTQRHSGVYKGGGDYDKGIAFPADGPDQSAKVVPRPSGDQEFGDAGAVCPHEATDYFDSPAASQEPVSGYCDTAAIHSQASQTFGQILFSLGSSYGHVVNRGKCR